jgi:hypothetical protein
VAARSWSCSRTRANRRAAHDAWWHHGRPHDVRHVVGLLWLVATFVVIAALVELIRREAKKT